MRKKSVEAAVLFLLILSGMVSTVFACTGNCADGTCGLASLTFAIPRSVITADTLVILLKAGNVGLVECRRAEQKVNMRIPGALVIHDNEDVASFIDKLPARNSLIVIYPGLEGGNLDEMVSALRWLGFTSIVEFQAGIQGWLTYGYKVEEGSVP